MIEDLVSMVAVYSIAGMAMAALSRGLDRPLRSLMAFSFAAHAAAAPLQVLLTQGVLGGGDMFAYHTYGLMLAEWARFDSFRAVPEIVSGALRLPAEFPFRLYGEATGSTGAMQCLSALLMLATGDSLYGACAIIGSLNAIGQGIAFLVIRRAFPAELHARIAFAMLLTPSVIFWTSGLLKESIAMIGFGPMIAGAFLLVYERRRLGGALLLAAGAVPFYVLKPYVLAGFLVAGPVLLYARRAIRLEGAVRFRPIPITLAALSSVVGIAVLGWLFPEYSVDEFADEAAHLQEIGATVEGGSNVQLVSSGTRSLAGQLAYAPIALLTTLFRPLIFEARGAAMLMAAAEATVLSFVFAQSLTRGGRQRIALLLKGSPVVLAGLAFIGVFGVAVGLATTNLGTLSRYRIPMMPFWALFVALASPPRAGAVESATVQGDLVRPEVPRRA